MSFKQFFRKLRFRFNNWRLQRLHKECEKLHNK